MQSLHQNPRFVCSNDATSRTFGRLEQTVSLRTPLIFGYCCDWFNLNYQLAALSYRFHREAAFLQEARERVHLM